MGLFSNPADAEVDKVTDEKLSTEPWNLILEICDKAGNDQQVSRDYFKSILRRLNHNDPHVVTYALTLLDACISNCGLNFHLAVASREFEKEYKKLLTKHSNQPQLITKMKTLLKKWSENEFKDDPQLNLIPSLYRELKKEGIDFTDHSVPKKTNTLRNDPNFAASQQEEDDLAKAIELSLKDASSSPKTKAYSSEPVSTTNITSSLYPSMSLTRGATSAPPAKEPRKVRALYDFEDAEDNELKFLAGEIIHVLDDSDPNWWKGYNQRGEGLFPANFVTADLNAEPEEAARLDASKAKKAVQFSENEGAAKIDYSNQVVEINEEKIDRLLHLLHEANPEDESGDTEEMLQLEALVNQMGPLIDSELEKVDRKHAQMTQLSRDLVVAFNLYHKLMKEPEQPMYMPPYSLGHQPQMMYGQMNAMGHPGYQMPTNPMYQMPPTGIPVGMGPPNQPGNMMMGQPSPHVHPSVFPPSHLPNNQRPIMSTQIHNGTQQQQQQPQQQHQHFNGGMTAGLQSMPQVTAPPVQNPTSIPTGSLPNMPMQQHVQGQPQSHVAMYGQNMNAVQQGQQMPPQNYGPNVVNHQSGIPGVMQNGSVDPAHSNSYVMSPQHHQQQQQHSQQQQQPIQSQSQQQLGQPAMNNYGHQFQTNPQQSPMHMIPGGIMSPPSNTMIGTSDSKNNIPVYQQQR